MPIKSQKFVYSKIDFEHKSPSEVFHDIVDAMQQVSRNKTQVAVLNVYAKMSLSDKDILDAFGDRNQKAPLLLGQSVLGRLGKIEIDNSKHILKITHKK